MSQEHQGSRNEFHDLLDDDGDDDDVHGHFTVCSLQVIIPAKYLLLCVFAHRPQEIMLGRWLFSQKRTKAFESTVARRGLWLLTSALCALFSWWLPRQLLFLSYIWNCSLPLNSKSPCLICASLKTILGTRWQSDGLTYSIVNTCGHIYLVLSSWAFPPLFILPVLSFAGSTQLLDL